MKISTRIFIVGLLFASCDGGGHQDHGTNNARIAKSPSDSLYQTVLGGHDVGMEKMGQISRYQKLIKARIDSLDASAKPDLRLKSELTMALEELNYAEESMNTWMQEFDADKAGASEPEKFQFYEKEKQKVDKVNQNISESLAKAKALVGN